MRGHNRTDFPQLLRQTRRTSRLAKRLIGPLSSGPSPMASGRPITARSGGAPRAEASLDGVQALAVIAARYRCAKTSHMSEGDTIRTQYSPLVAFATAIRMTEKSFVKGISPIADSGSDATICCCFTGRTVAHKSTHLRHSFSPNAAAKFHRAVALHTDGARRAFTAVRRDQRECLPCRKNSAQPVASASASIYFLLAGWKPRTVEKSALAPLNSLSSLPDTFA